MDIEQLKRTISESRTITEVCYKLYGNKYYGNRITIKNYIKQFNMDISHFVIDYSNKKMFFKRKDISEILVLDSTHDTTNLKNRLYKEGLKERRCEKCGQDENWYGKHMSLILDHKNGNNKDNRIENLQIVCPNCSATLPTFSGKNVNRNNRLMKMKKLVNPNFNKSESQRKVKRPEYNILLTEINELGYSATGRKYGVSDNAIRKWKRYYEKNIVE